MLYVKDPELFHARLDDIIHVLFENNGEHLTSLISMFDNIAKNHPELITSTQIDYIFTSLKSYPNTFNQINYVFNVLGYIAAAQPNLFDKYQDEFIRLMVDEQKFEVYTCFQQYLVASTILHGENRANECLTLLLNLLKTIPKLSPNLSTQIFHTCQLIGLRHKQALANKREDFISFQSNSTCQMLIDLIDGNKMSEESQAMMKSTLDEVAQIEKRVVHTERDVKNITKSIKRQELNVCFYFL